MYLVFSAEYWQKKAQGLAHQRRGQPKLGARLRGRTATQCSKKGSEKVLGRVLGRGFSEGF